MDTYSTLEAAIYHYGNKGYQAILMTNGRWIMYGLNTKFAAIELIRRNGRVEAYPCTNVGLFSQETLYPQSNIYKLPRTRQSKLM